jgi:FkbM family methyltransferase
MWWYVFKFSRAINKLGFYSACKFYCLRGFKAKGTYQLNIRNYKKPVYLRFSTSDIEVFDQIIISEEFEPFVAKNRNEKIKIIIDAGANIGLSSIYFSIHYPEAKIFAIEPERENFRIMKRNFHNVWNFVLIMKAVWNNDETLFIKDRGTGNWGFSTSAKREDPKGVEIEGLSINSIIRRYKMDKIDILKLDIEGAEKELFEKGTLAWLANCRYILIEVHDYINPGASRAVFEALESYILDDVFGEYLVFKNTLIDG